ncbi:unnamed protein product [Ectocarpus fasciculatus]
MVNAPYTLFPCPSTFHPPSEFLTNAMWRSFSSTLDTGFGGCRTKKCPWYFPVCGNRTAPVPAPPPSTILNSNGLARFLSAACRSALFIAQLPAHRCTPVVSSTLKSPTMHGIDPVGSGNGGGRGGAPPPQAGEDRSGTKHAADRARSTSASLHFCGKLRPCGARNTITGVECLPAEPPPLLPAPAADSPAPTAAAAAVPRSPAFGNNCC